MTRWVHNCQIQVKRSLGNWIENCPHCTRKNPLYVPKKEPQEQLKECKRQLAKLQELRMRVGMLQKHTLPSGKPCVCSVCELIDFALTGCD